MKSHKESKESGNYGAQPNGLRAQSKTSRVIFRIRQGNGLRAIMITGLLAIGLTLGACGGAFNRVVTINCAGSADTACGLQQRIDNPRFQLSQPSDPNSDPNFLAGQDFYIRQSDVIQARVDSFVQYTQHSGGRCNYQPGVNQTDSCDACDFINLDPGHNYNCHGGYFPPLSPPAYLLGVDAYPGFSVDAPPIRLGTYYSAGPQLQEMDLTPSEDATLKLTDPFPVYNATPPHDGGPVVLAQTKVFVVTSGGSQLRQYQVAPIPAPGAPAGAVYYAGGDRPLPDGNAMVPEDAYSDRLTIGRVRVLIGHQGVDPHSGKLMVTNSRLAQPTRVIYISGFTNGQSVTGGGNDNNRCYANYRSLNGSLGDAINNPQGTSRFDIRFQDGDIDFTRCRTSPPVPGQNDTGHMIDIKPLFQKIGDMPFQPLTWIVEFNPAGGGVAPEVHADEIMVIEFTIVAK